MTTVVTPSWGAIQKINDLDEKTCQRRNLGDKKTRGYQGYGTVAMINKLTLWFVPPPTLFSTFILDLFRQRRTFFCWFFFVSGSEGVSKWLWLLWYLVTNKTRAVPIHQRKPASWPSKTAPLPHTHTHTCTHTSIPPPSPSHTQLRLQLYTASLNNIQNDEWRGQACIHHPSLFF